MLKICYENIYEENFKNKYGLSSEIVVLEEDEATIVSLATGEFDNIPFSCIGDKLKGTDILQCNGKIYYRESRDFVEFIKTKFDVEVNPIIIGDSIYFVAEEPDDLSDWPQNWLWEYNNGQYKKIHDLPIVNANLILSFDSSIIFVEDNDPNDRILCLDTTSGETKTICYGFNICWKEKGESFFYCPEYGSLAIFDLETGISSIIDDNITIYASPVYNENENVLIVFCHKENSGSLPLMETAFYYIDLKECIPFSKYLKHINAKSTKDFITSLPLVYWE